MNAVIFDLDGTTFRQNIFLPQACCITEALTTVSGHYMGFGPEDVPEDVQVDWTGQTDYSIAHQMLMKARVRGDHDEMLRRWEVLYADLFRRRCPTSLESHVTDGWPDLLENCQRVGWTNRVVTGNICDVALRKVMRAGLADYFDLEGSGYGNEMSTREGALTEALRGCHEAVVVGDTWRDIEAAHRCGVPCIAWKTPRHTKKSLKAAERIVTTGDTADVFVAITELMGARAHA